MDIYFLNLRINNGLFFLQPTFKKINQNFLKGPIAYYELLKS